MFKLNPIQNINFQYLIKETIIYLKINDKPLLKLIKIVKFCL